MATARARRTGSTRLALTCASSAALVAGPALAAPASPAAANPSGGDPAWPPRTLQLLAFNDYHGALEPPTGSGGRVVTGTQLGTDGKPVDVTVDAGGAEYLATHLRRLRSRAGASFTLSAGDQFGASPLLSAAFHDEPTALAMRAMGVDVATVGNHEFDEGYRELLRMVRGGCLPDGDGKDNQNSCPDGRYRGTGFPVVAANVTYAGTAKTVLPPYAILRDRGITVGFVGVVLKDTPNIVSQAGIKGLAFGDEVAAVTRAVGQLKARGVNVIVAMVHQGGMPAKVDWKDPSGKTHQVSAPYDATCGKGGTLTPDSEILPIARALDPAVDAIITGHTHQAYACSIPDPAGQPRLVTSALSSGRLVTELNFFYDRTRRDVIRSTARATQHVVTRTVAKDPKVTALIDRFRTLVAPIANREVGRITADVTRTPTAAGETPLGDLIADAMLADTSAVGGAAKPVLALMNPGGIRADLSFATAPGKTDAPGVVTYEEAFTVQPFNNYLVTMNLTGAQIHALLRQQWTGSNSAQPKMLQVSKGFEYTWTGSGATRAIVPGSVKLGGAVVADDASTTYRVVTNSFLADGGDGFAAFRDGAARYVGGLDIDAFAAYLKAVTPYTPGTPSRIGAR